MSEELRTLLGEHSEWRLVLAAYAAAEAAAPEVEAIVADEADGESVVRGARWVTRVTHVDGVPNERLAPLHGRLIAHGLLQFNLGGRDTGVLYRVTGEAKRFVAELAERAELQTEAGKLSASSLSNPASRAA